MRSRSRDPSIDQTMAVSDEVRVMFDRALQEMLSDGRLTPAEVVDIVMLERRLMAPWWRSVAEFWWWPVVEFLRRMT